FVDFLTASPAPDELPPMWTVDRRSAHEYVMGLCLALMDDAENGVHFGVSGAITSYRSNDDQPIPLRLMSSLSYACTEWIDHAMGAISISPGVQRTLQSFLKTKVLYWIEALGVERKVGYTRMLWDLSKVS